MNDEKYMEEFRGLARSLIIEEYLEDVVAYLQQGQPAPAEAPQDHYDYFDEYAKDILQPVNIEWIESLPGYVENDAGLWAGLEPLPAARCQAYYTGLNALTDMFTKAIARLNEVVLPDDIYNNSNEIKRAIEEAW